MRDVGVGPYASWLWISQPDDSLRPDDAHVALVGAHATLGEMARYLTRAPKGVFFYRDHDEMDADRPRWLVKAVLAHARGS